MWRKTTIPTLFGKGRMVNWSMNILQASYFTRHQSITAQTFDHCNKQTTVLDIYRNV